MGVGPMEEVQGLAVHNGLRCTLCGFLAKKESHVRKHFTKQHPDSAFAQGYEQVRLQRLQRSYGPYFQISNLSDAEQSVDDMIISDMRRAADEALAQQSTPEDDRAISPWLLTTKWHLLVKDYAPSNLTALVRMPSKNQFPALHEAVHQYALSAAEVLPIAPEIVLQRLNTPYEAKTYVLLILVKG